MMTLLMSRNTFNLENGDYTKDWRKIPAVQLQIKDDPARGVWVRQLCGVTAVAAAASEWNPPTRQTQLVSSYPAWFSRTYSSPNHRWAYSFCNFEGQHILLLSFNGDFGYLVTQSTSVWVGEVADDATVSQLSQLKLKWWWKKVLVCYEIWNMENSSNLLMVIGCEAYL